MKLEKWHIGVHSNDSRTVVPQMVVRMPPGVHELQAKGHAKKNKIFY